MALLLKNGNIDVLIEGGVIAAVGGGAVDYADKSGKAVRTVDCTGLTVIPGICDMHVHFRDPGQTHKEDLVSGAAAAAAGGVTAVMCMPNTSPVIDTAEAVRDIVGRSAGLPVRVYPCAAITRGLLGRELTDFCALKQAGAVAVSDDGKCVPNAALMGEAMVKAAQAGLAIISHCEDTGFDANASSRISENVVTARELCLAENLNVPIHIAHVSAKEAVGYIKLAAERGVRVTCEVAPHHFTLTDSSLAKRDADYKMNPPLRKEEDVAAIIEALGNQKNGCITCIASDHAPHSAAEKSDYDTAPNGVVGLETILAVTLTRLYHTGILPIDRIVEMLCVNPRRLLGITGGTLTVGSPADIAVADINEEWVVEPQKLRSKSKNTCFKGMTLKGRVKYTITGGEVVYDYKVD